MEERDSEKYLAIMVETICLKGINQNNVYDYLYGTSSKDIVVQGFDNGILQILDKYFPLFSIGTNKTLKSKNKIALKKELWDNVCKLSSKNDLLGFEKHLCLIIYFAQRTRLSNKGSASKEFKELVELKKLLSQTYTKKIKDYNIEYEDSKYSINHLKIELIDENGEKTNVNIPNEILLSNFFTEAFFKIIDDFKIDENSLQKVNTNHLFCQQFFNFINTQTSFSTNHGHSERQILLLFIKVYRLGGHQFLSFKNIKSNREELVIDIVKQWLKTTNK